MTVWSIVITLILVVINGFFVGLEFALVGSRADSVDSHTINGITIELARLAREHGGRYDGWECAATRGAEA